MVIDEKSGTEAAKTEEAFTPNYAVWILSLMTVIGIFYAVVFYAGTGTCSLTH